MFLLLQTFEIMQTLAQTDSLKHHEVWRVVKLGKTAEKLPLKLAKLSINLKL